VAELQTILASVRERGFAEDTENTEEGATGLYTASVSSVNEDGVALALLITLRPGLVDLAPALARDRRRPARTPRRALSQSRPAALVLLEAPIGRLDGQRRSR
jgi:hypothetical protein